MLLLFFVLLYFIIRHRDVWKPYFSKDQLRMSEFKTGSFLTLPLFSQYCRSFTCTLLLALVLCSYSFRSSFKCGNLFYFHFIKRFDQLPGSSVIIYVFSRIDEKHLTIYTFIQQESTPHFKSLPPYKLQPQSTFSV